MLNKWWHFHGLYTWELSLSMTMVLMPFWVILPDFPNSWRVFTGITLPSQSLSRLKNQSEDEHAQGWVMKLSLVPKFGLPPGLLKKKTEPSPTTLPVKHESWILFPFGRENIPKENQQENRLHNIMWVYIYYYGYIIYNLYYPFQHWWYQHPPSCSQKPIKFTIEVRLSKTLYKLKPENGGHPISWAQIGLTIPRWVCSIQRASTRVG